MKRVFAILIIIFSSVLISCAHQQMNENVIPLDSPEEAKFYQVVVKHVMIDQSNKDIKVPVIILANKENDNQFLPIWVGISEGLSIDMTLKKQSPPRPGTHDLFTNVLGQFNMKLTKVIITEMQGDTYLASITVKSRDETRDIDARPSDAIAIALRTDAPIFVSEKVISKHGWAEVQQNDKDKEIKNVKPETKDDKSI
jgi:bifunctional DNase/RNase